MAPKLKLPKTLADAVKDGNQGILNFFSVKRKAGRPRKRRTIETLKGETTLALEENCRRHGWPQMKKHPPFSSGQNQKIPPPATPVIGDNDDLVPTVAKKRRVNWSKGDDWARLE